MILEQQMRFRHPAHQKPGVGALRQSARNGLAGEIVRRHQFRACVRAVEHQAVPIGKSWIEPSLFTRKPFIQKQNEFSRFLRGDLARAVVQHRRVRDVRFPRQRHQIAAVGHIGLHQRNAKTGGFQRRSARIIPFGIIAEYGEVRRVAAGFHAIRHRFYQPEFSVARELIHHGMMRRIQRCFSA
ncbi:hypothetical protein SDC9_101653 [bioreactor metagenome]|uniref:Uncharacterized protein n=1 Tax=bioreactor metagenome TaxID=1076179 RepID=A0A645AP46_9ZZZZ